mmetsp:Transcript_4787/g.7664  ORF Transcript_4787/g.7664 Transcript_4787/m.7664 type:complete len:232 (+) Transcript_4787:460-1155(+)
MDMSTLRISLMTEEEISEKAVASVEVRFKTVDAALECTSKLRTSLEAANVTISVPRLHRAASGVEESVPLRCKKGIVDNLLKKASSGPRLLSKAGSGPKKTHSIVRVPDFFRAFPKERIEFYQAQPNEVIDQHEFQSKILAVVAGYCLAKKYKVILERLDRDDILGLVNFIGKGSYDWEAVIAGKEGATLAMVPFEIVSHALEDDDDFASFFYDYSCRYIANRLKLIGVVA